MSLKKQFLYLMVAVGLLASCGRTVTVTQIDIIPEPVFMVQKEGSYTLDRSVAIAVSGLGQNSPTAKYIMNSLRHAHLRPSLVSLSEESDIELIINDTINTELGDEGYLLEVRPTGLRLSANTERGLFYAYRTLVQMLPPDVLEHTYSSITLPECTILDYPRFTWRGVQIADSSSTLNIKDLKHLLDVMATYKLNRLEVLNEGEELEEIVAYGAALCIDVRGRETASDSLEPPIEGPQKAFSVAEAAMMVTRGAKRIVMTPDDYCRYDVYQADPRYQPMAADGIITLSKAYLFDPAPQGTNKHIESCIVGGECRLGTEYISTPAEAEYMLLPRLLALAECLWSPHEAKSWNHFRKKVELQKLRLDSKSYNYCEGSFTPLFRATRVDDATMNIAIETEVPNTYIFYTTDTTTPTRHSKVYLGPVNLKRGTHIKIQPVYKDQERDSVYEFIIK